jgi:hypothetical protein
VADPQSGPAQRARYTTSTDSTAACRARTSGQPSGCGPNRIGRSSHHAHGAATFCPTAPSVVSRNLPHPRRPDQSTQRKSPAKRGFLMMRRRGLEPPPGYPGPGPQPGNPGVRSVQCVQNVLSVQEFGRTGRNGRSGGCRGCCHGSPIALRDRLLASDSGPELPLLVARVSRVAPSPSGSVGQTPRPGPALARGSRDRWQARGSTRVCPLYRAL